MADVIARGVLMAANARRPGIFQIPAHSSLTIHLSFYFSSSPLPSLTLPSSHPLYEFILPLLFFFLSFSPFLCSRFISRFTSLLVFLLLFPFLSFSIWFYSPVAHFLSFFLSLSLFLLFTIHLSCYFFSSFSSLPHCPFVSLLLYAFYPPVALSPSILSFILLFFLTSFLSPAHHSPLVLGLLLFSFLSYSLLFYLVLS